MLPRVLSLLFLFAGVGLAAEPNYAQYLQGRFVFERNCMLCHGERGAGDGELSKGLSPKPRSFREGMFKFRTTPWQALPTDADLRKTITHGLTGTAMGAFAQLPADDIDAVIEYIKTFSRRWRKAENYAEPLAFPAPPVWLADAAQSAPHIATGKVLFTATCTPCHGPNADGKGPNAATLIDIWNQHVTPSDLRQPHLRCGDDATDIFRVLTTGLNGTPMVSFAQTLSDLQRWQIAVYITSIRIEGPALLNPSSTAKQVPGK